MNSSIQVLFACAMVAVATAQPLRLSGVVDFTEANLKTLRVKQLRLILQERRATCELCPEKPDLVHRVMEVKDWPVHDDAYIRARLAEKEAVLEKEWLSAEEERERQSEVEEEVLRDLELKRREEAQAQRIETKQYRLRAHLEQQRQAYEEAHRAAQVQAVADGLQAKSAAAAVDAKAATATAEGLQAVAAVAAADAKAAAAGIADQ